MINQKREEEEEQKKRGERGKSRDERVSSVEEIKRSIHCEQGGDGSKEYPSSEYVMAFFFFLCWLVGPRVQVSYTPLPPLVLPVALCEKRLQSLSSPFFLYVSLFFLISLLLLFPLEYSVRGKLWGKCREEFPSSPPRHKEEIDNRDYMYYRFYELRITCFGMWSALLATPSSPILILLSIYLFMYLEPCPEVKERERGEERVGEREREGRAGGNLPYRT